MPEKTDKEAVRMDQEHNCLPPLENRVDWVLLANAIQSFTEALQKVAAALSHGAVDAFKELGRLTLSPRSYRKAVRWDEKNRRRRLKGLPEKPYPYPRIWKTYKDGKT